MIGNGGDQLCGRYASGLPPGDIGFAALPPHFSVETVAGTVKFIENLAFNSTIF